MFNNPFHESRHSGGGGEAVTAAWRERLHRCLASNATPVVLFPASVRSAASLWSGTRAWTHQLRAAGIGAGDTVWSALPVGEAVLQLLLACLWDGVSLMLLQPDLLEGGELDALRLVEQADGALLLLPECGALSPTWVHAPAAGGWPSDDRPLTRRQRVSTVPEVREDPFVGVRGEHRLTHAQLLHGFTEQFDDPQLHGTRVVSLIDWLDMEHLFCGVLFPMLCIEELFLIGADDQTHVVHVLQGEPIGHVIVAHRHADGTRATCEGFPHVVVHAW